MKKKLLLFILFAILFAWFGKDGHAQNPPVTASRIIRAASLPATCRVGDVYFKTAATVGTYQCKTANTWTVMGGGGGSGCATTGTAGQILVDDGAGGCTSSTPTIASSTITASLTGHSSLDLPLTGGTLTGNLLFTDATLDIGASGATRPRNIFISGSLTGNVTGALTGNASTATALAANPANCSAGTLPRGITAAGVAEGCAAVDLAAEVTGLLPAANLVNSGVFTGDAATTFPALTIGNAAITAVKMVNAGVHTGDCTTTFPNCTISAAAITAAKMVNSGVFTGDVTTTFPAVTVAKVNGITYSATAAAHSVEVITTANTTATAKVMPDCTDTGGNHLNFTQSTDAFSCGTSGGGGITGTLTNANAIVSVSSSGVVKEAALLSTIPSIVFSQGSAGAPAVDNAGEQTIGSSGGNSIKMAPNHVAAFNFQGSDGSFQASSGNGGSAEITKGVASATAPVYSFIGDTTTGIGYGATGYTSMVGAGAEIARFGALGMLVKKGGIYLGGTKFTASGCSNGTLVGGATGGKLTLGANNCTVVVTMGDTGTATNGWTCWASDQTAPTIGIAISASNTTTASINIPAGAGATDVISFGCNGY